MEVTLKNVLRKTGTRAQDEALAKYSELEDSSPAICFEDCMVEPDGHRPPARRPLFWRSGSSDWREYRGPQV